MANRCLAAIALGGNPRAELASNEEAGKFVLFVD